MAASTLVSILLGYASFALNARLLGSTEFGLFGALLAVVSVVSVVLRPLHTIATHLAADALSTGRPETVASATGWTTAFCAAGALLLFAGLVALREPIQMSMHAETFAPIGLLAPLLFGTALWQIASGHLLGLRRFGAYAAASIADSVLRTLAIAPLVLLWGVAGSLAAYTSGMLIASVVAMKLSGGLDWRIDASLMVKHIVSIGGASLVLTLVIALLQNADLVLLRTYAEPATVGGYAGAATIGTLAFAIAAPLYLPLYSHVRAAHVGGARTTQLLFATLLSICAGGVLAIGISIPFGTVMAGILLGNSLAAAGSYLPLYLAKTTAILMLFVSGQYALATDRSGLVLLSTGSSILSICLLIALQPEPASAPLFGMIGAAVGVVPIALSPLSSRAQPRRQG